MREGRREAAFAVGVRCRRAPGQGEDQHFACNRIVGAASAATRGPAVAA